MQEDDDPVIQEIPVYLSKLLADKLFLYQYPVRPRDISSDNFEVMQSRIKPKHQEVRLELALDTKSPNFDTSKAELIALNADGSTNRSEEKKTEDKLFKNDVMDKQVLESTRALSDTNNCAVAVYHDKELHITPLQGIVHLRPSFGYLDMSDKRAKEEAKEQGEGDVSGEEDEEAKQVTVKFARQENDRVKRARERSFGYLSKKSAEEAWYYTQYHAISTEKAELERGKLYCVKTDDKVDELNLTTSDYMKYLITTDDTDDSKCDVVSLKSLKLLPLVEQVRTLLKEESVLEYELVTLLDQSSDMAGLLRIVQQVAVLVQGNWVIRSDILYPKDTASKINGVAAELMCRGRDHILYQFTQMQHVDRIKESAVIKLPREEIQEILEQVSMQKPKQGWQLKLPFDKDFISRYPEVVQRQQMWWEAKQKQLREAFAGSKTRRKSNRDSSVSDNEITSDARPSPKRTSRRKSSHRESLSSDNESGAEGAVGGMKEPKANCAKIPRRTKQTSCSSAAIY
ncbi:hypothetical protein L9F63_004145, partial [Diploptera punctata]